MSALSQFKSRITARSFGFARRGGPGQTGDSRNRPAGPSADEWVVAVRVFDSCPRSAAPVSRLRALDTAVRLDPQGPHDDDVPVRLSRIS